MDDPNTCITVATEARRLTLKTDQEYSLVASENAVSNARVGDTVPAESPAQASKYNGPMERAVRSWTGLVIIVNTFIEHMRKQDLPSDGA